MILESEFSRCIKIKIKDKIADQVSFSGRNITYSFGRTQLLMKSSQHGSSPLLVDPPTDYP